MGGKNECNEAAEELNRERRSRGIAPDKGKLERFQRRKIPENRSCRPGLPALEKARSKFI